MSPHSQQVVTGLAVVYQLQGRKDQAIKVYKRFLRTNPDNIEVRRRLGGLLVGERKFDEALEEYEEIEDLETDPRETRTKIGLVYFEKGDYDAAITAFNLVLAASPGDNRVRYYLGVAYAAAKEPGEARRELDTIPSDARQYIDARLHLAYLYQKDGDLDDAIAVIRTGLKKRTNDADLLGMLVSLYREKREFETASGILEDMVTRDPTNDRLRFTLGALYDEAKQKDKTIAEMERAIELNPKNAAALNYLGYTFAEMDVRLDEAEVLVRRALEIEPNEGFYIDSLGWIYFQRGNYVVAIEHLETAVELSGDDPTISEHLGDAYERIGRSGDAVRLYHQALGSADEKNQIDRLRKKIATLEGAEKAQRDDR